MILFFADFFPIEIESKRLGFSDIVKVRIKRVIRFYKYRKISDQTKKRVTDDDKNNSIPPFPTLTATITGQNRTKVCISRRLYSFNRVTIVFQIVLNSKVYGKFLCYAHLLLMGTGSQEIDM